jgi:hypothetical protein
MDARRSRLVGMTSPLEDPVRARPVTSVQRDLTITCFDRLNRSAEFDVVLSYDAADPYAVTMRFPEGSGAIPWVFARSLLSDGLTQPVGQGDVHVWPSLDELGCAVVAIRLSSPDGQVVMEARTSQVWAFLHASYAVVAQGQESANVDLDAMVTHLLAD